ncbi:ATP-binding protein [Desulfovibrio cuneatus]|uniref:ATP-binding protein n=1 Tax=Desulfovibrio cuneatus TaxID=159728 RepID=UPI00146FAFCA|nr:ATP-binding protein [Desulfovibrio cuneatus]
MASFSTIFPQQTDLLQYFSSHDSRHALGKLFVSPPRGSVNASIPGADLRASSLTLQVQVLAAQESFVLVQMAPPTAAQGPALTPAPSRAYALSSELESEQPGHQRSLSPVFFSGLKGAVDILLGCGGNYSASLALVLELLGEGVGVDAVQLWVTPAETMLAQQVAGACFWKKEGLPAANGPLPDGGQFLVQFSEWKGPLLAGQVVGSHSPETRSETKAFLRESLMRSVCCAPVSGQGRFLGAVVFVSYQEEKLWSDAEKEALGMVGTLMGAAFSLAHTAEKLSEAYTRFDDVSLATGEVICEVSTNGDVGYISERSQEVFSIKPDDVKGMDFIHLLGGQDYAEQFFTQIERQNTSAGYFRGVEHAILDQAGKERFLRSSGAPFYDKQGQAQGIRFTSVDITQEQERRTHLQETLAALRHANEELAAYARLTELLGNEAEAANQAKSTFLSTIGHEVRTPIHVISGMAYLVSRSALSEEQREFVEKIQKASEALLGIFNNILEYANTGTGKVSFEEVPFRFESVVYAAVRTFDEYRKSKKLQCTVYIDPVIPHILKGDVDRLGVVFKNLVQNAIKYTETGGVRVCCVLQENLGSEVLLACQVEDSGIGIDEAGQEHLFEPFYQRDASDTRRYGGTGVGLALTRKLVEAMGGEISLRSQPGLGTVVAFTLRLKISNTSSPEGLCELEGGTLQPLPEWVHVADKPFAGQSLLLVVDEKAGSYAPLTTAIEQMQLHVTTVHSAKEALGAVQTCDEEKRFDIIVVVVPVNRIAEYVHFVQSMRLQRVGERLPLLVYAGCSAQDHVCFGRIKGLSGCLNPEFPAPAVQERLERWLFHCGSSMPAKQHMADSVNVVVAAPAAPGALAKEVVALAALLEEDDADAREVAMRLGPQLRVVDGRAGKRVVDAASDFNFAEALEALAVIRDKLGV